MLEFLDKIPAEYTSGLVGSSKSCVLAKLAPLPAGRHGRLIITSSTEQAQKIKSEIELISGREVYLFPALDVIPGEERASSLEVVGERLKIELLWQEGIITVAPVRAVMVKTIKKLENLRISEQQNIGRESLIEKLIGFGYKRLPIVGERGEFSVRGGLIDVFPVNSEWPVRLELMDEKVESLRSFDPQNQRSLKEEKNIIILSRQENYEVPVFDRLPSGAEIVIDEPLQVSQWADRFYAEVVSWRGEENCLTYEEILRRKTSEASSFLMPGQSPIFSAAPKFFGRLEEMRRELKEKADYQIYLVSRHAARLKEVIDLPVISGELSAGFIYEAGKIMVLTDYEIFGAEFKPSRAKKPAPEGVDESLLADLNEGDYVVHENYGVGIFRGLSKLPEVEGEPLLIEYAGGDKLYVPLTMLGMVEKYSGGGDYRPKLSRLGSAEWIKVKNRVKKSVKDMTKELLELYAARRRTPGLSFPKDDVWQVELENTFPYEETPDQLRAIREVKRDMESGQPMDRLVCGDVGYGKTEVAIRAAAKAAASGRQAAILVPTTILAEQHYHNFKERFKSFPFTVEMLSRFKSKAEQKNIVKTLATGGIDIIIGTHRLLSKDIKFSNLGLLIIDEEQRFGVASKEKLKHIRKNVDVMTLTATPIPRTLYFSLSGARDLSLINTPPLDRSPVRTYVLAWNEAVIREAILRELDRGGQVYFVYNRVEKIEGMAAKLKKMVPEARIGIGHGQMREKNLEEVMVKFLNHEYDVLLCSTIIESGIDIISVNTIIIDEADRLGLSQLYQLRGRVGRGPVRAYAYLFYHPEKVLTETALERLKAVQEFTALGSGYKLAMRDLEIRGAGNLLGAEQSGHLLAVGFDLYCELLEEAVREVKGIPEPTPRQVEIDLKTEAFIPADYIEDERQRIAVYRRMNLLEHPADLLDLKAEAEDRFGQIPAPLLKLLEIMDLKLTAKERGVKSIKQKDDQIRIEYFSGSSKTFSGLKIGEIKDRIAPRIGK